MFILQEKQINFVILQSKTNKYSIKYWIICYMFILEKIETTKFVRQER